MKFKDIWLIELFLLENGEIKKDGNPDEIIDEFLSEMEEPEDIENISTDETVIKVEDIYKDSIYSLGRSSTN